MMVKQTRILFDIENVENMRIVCGRCGSEMLFPPSQNREIPKNCPYCPAEWADDLSPKNPAWDGAVAVLQNIAYLSQLKDPIVRIRFEIDGEKA